MHFIRVSEDSTAADLAEAATHLRKRQQGEPDPLVKAWLGEDIDDLLELYSMCVKREQAVVGAAQAVHQPVFR